MTVGAEVFGPVVSGLGYEMIVGAAELAKVRREMVALFSEAFQRPYPEERFDHYYRDVPCGEPAAVLVRDHRRLVGFGGLLPQQVGDAAPVRYGLFVAAMIAPRYREGGLTYVNLTRRLHALARRLDHAYVLAFPNARAFAPLVRLGGFEPVDEAVWVDGELRAAGYGAFLDAEAAKDGFAGDTLAWRLGRFRYEVDRGVVTKDFEGRRNLIDVLAKGSGAGLFGVFPWWRSAGPCPHREIGAEPVRMCWRPLSGDTSAAALRRSLLFSDVF